MPDSCLVVAGDNVFTSDLRNLVDEHRRVGGPTVVCLYDVGSLELARNCGVVRVDEDFRVILLEEPSAPEKHAREHKDLSLSEGCPAEIQGHVERGEALMNSEDSQSGLYFREPAYGYSLPGI
ncbi:MAG: hypothetical protein QW341_05825 [Candidatus Bathyarchaeia archaeon]